MKMKRVKRICAIFLATVMAVGTLAGCGKKEATDDGTTQAAEEKESSTDSTDVPTGEPIKLNLFSLNGTYDTAKGEEAKAAVEEAIWTDLGLNVDLNIISSDSFDTDQIAVKIAAGELDAVSSNMTLTSWQALIEKGVLTPLDDLLAEYGSSLMEEIDSKLWDPYKVNGTTYLMPIQSPVPFYCGTWVRMDLFRKYGIDEVPTTVSELIEGLRVVCENEPDMVGMAAGHTSWLTNSGPLSFHPVDEDGNMTRTNADGTGMEKYMTTDASVTMYWENDLFRQHLQRFADLYADGILDPEFFTTTFDHADQLVATDRVVCIGNGYGFQSTADEKPEQEWTFLTNLTNDLTGLPTTWRYEYEVGMFVGIVSTSPYAEEIMQILNWAISSNENYALTNWGVEGEHWQYVEDENGTRVERFKDDAGNRVVSGGLGGMLLNLRSEWYVPLTENYEGSEWSKIFEDEPTTKTWANCDGFINYQYETDATTRTDMITLASEVLVNIVTGKVGVDEGLDKMAEDLYSMGYQSFHDEREEQYMTGMGLK